jgi:hypothetical protein
MMPSRFEMRIYMQTLQRFTKLRTQIWMDPFMFKMVANICRKLEKSTRNSRWTWDTRNIPTYVTTATIIIDPFVMNLSGGYSTDPTEPVYTIHRNKK